MMYGYFNLFDQTASLLDYLDTPLIIQETIMTFAYKNYLEENHYYYQELPSIGKTIKGLNLFRDLYEVIDRKSVNFKPFAQSDKDVLFNARIMINNDDEAMIINQIRAYLKLSKVVVALDDDHQL